MPVRMRPLSFAERGVEEATVSLGGLLTGHAEVSGRTAIKLTDYVEEITASGFPAIRAMNARVRAAELGGYVDNVVRREFPEQGYEVRRPETLRGWLSAYAAATATTTTYSRILDAATPGQSEKPAKTTTMVYRDALASLWLLDPIPAWAPGRNHLGRLGRAPKHLLADPALASRLLGLDAPALLRGEQGSHQLVEGSILSRLFEHLAAMSVATYAQAADAQVSHMRVPDGSHEVDLVVARPDGRVLAIEVKMASHVEDADVRHLHWLRHKIGDNLIDAAVITAGPDAYRRRDHIAVVPLALLGP